MTGIALKTGVGRGLSGISMPSSTGARLTRLRPRGTRGKLENSLVDALGRHIVSGEWPPGKLIPPEPQLLADLGISRPTLRESLRVLASKGLIESRQKFGTFVLPMNTWNFLDPDLLSWLGSTRLTSQMVHEIIAFRRLIEPAVAAMAALGADPDGVRAIAYTLSEMKDKRDDHNAYLLADQAFHQAIFDATGNRFVSCLGAVVSTVLNLSFSIQQKSLLKPEQALALHSAVSQAIDAKDAHRAEKAMLNLLEQAEDELNQVFKKNPLKE